MSKQTNDPPKPPVLGGHARAAALSPEERSEIARKGGIAKALARLPRATHKGNFKDEFGVDVECYVLGDEQKTAVISQRGMGAALGLEQSSGVAITRFVRGDKIAPFVGGELSQKLENPLVFQWSPPVAKMGPPAVVHGYDATILIDICKAVIKADDEGVLLARQKQFAKQAHIIVNASAKAGIKGLVYALAGYDPDRQDVIAAFKLYVREEAREYEKEFPGQLYAEWYRLYQLKKPERNKPWKFRDLTIQHVYIPLAKSNGKILELTRAQRARSEERWMKLHQFLSEIGVKVLRTHLGQLLGIAQVSSDRAEYERNVEKVFGTQLGWDF
jgi:hypothetical protein